jgi:hypothetical protein
LKTLVVVLFLLVMLAIYAAIAAGFWFLFPAVSYLKWLLVTVLGGIFISVAKNSV